MKNKIFIILLIVLALTQCNKTNMARDIPDCIKHKIREFKRDNSQLIVTEYEFEGELIYSFGSTIVMPDGACSIYDKNCNYICHIGGIDGNLKINGVNFSEAKQIRIIFED